MAEPLTTRNGRIVLEYLDWLARHAPAGLTRIVEAENWCAGSTARADGTRCLVGHAADYYRDELGRCWDRDKAASKHWNVYQPAVAFDLLCRRFNRTRTVAAVKEAARERLAREEAGRP